MKLSQTMLLLAALAPLTSFASLPADGAQSGSPEQVLVIEPEPPSDTRYTFTFSCKREQREVAVEGRVHFVEWTGRVSEVTRIDIDSVELTPDQLAIINKAFPERAVQERPWITCDAGKIELGIPYRHSGTKREILRFLIDREGKVTQE